MAQQEPPFKPSDLDTELLQLWRLQLDQVKDMIAEADKHLVAVMGGDWSQSFYAWSRLYDIELRAAHLQRHYEAWGRGIATARRVAAERKAARKP